MIVRNAPALLHCSSSHKERDVLCWFLLVKGIKIKSRESGGSEKITKSHNVHYYVLLILATDRAAHPKKLVFKNLSRILLS